LVISVRFRAPHKEFSRPSRIILKLVVILIWIVTTRFYVRIPRTRALYRNTVTLDLDAVRPTRRQIEVFSLLVLRGAGGCDQHEATAVFHNQFTGTQPLLLCSSRPLLSRFHLSSLNKGTARGKNIRNTLKIFVCVIVNQLIIFNSNGL
jgi:hypothetical protein